MEIIRKGKLITILNIYYISYYLHYHSNKLLFSSDYKVKDKIFIGNDKNKCDVLLNHNQNIVIQSINCTIYWDYDLSLWKIKDGSNYSLSTMSTWVYLINSIEIYNGLIVRLYNSKIIFNYNSKI